jgi:MFS family permease
MGPVALAFAVLGQPGSSAARLGTVLAGRSVAQVVFMIAGGALADRFPRYQMMMASDLLAMAAQGSTAALFIAGHAPTGLLTGLSALNGAANALFIPASRALIPQIVDESDMQSATALIRLSENSASLVGAAISGVVIVAVGAGWALAIDAATFLVSAVLVLTSRAPRGGRSGRRLMLFTDLREGWQEFRSRQWGLGDRRAIRPGEPVLSMSSRCCGRPRCRNTALGNSAALSTRSVRRLPAGAREPAQR